MKRKGIRGHGIHSPFVFEFNRRVLNDGHKYQEYSNINDYRRSFAGSRKMITVDDQGAGSVVFSSEKRAVGDILRVTASNERTGRLLFRLAKYLHPAVTVELGTSLGFGTMCLATGFSGGKVYSLEACSVQQEIAGAGLRRAGVRNVELINGIFSEVLPELIGSIDSAGLVYFDGDHTMESLMWQFDQCMEKISPETVFVVGDIHWSDEMDKAWIALCGDPAVTLSIDLFYCGLLFFRKGMAKQHHILTFSD